MEKTLLAKNIIYLRKKRALSQHDLADQIGCKRTSIAVYESKNVEPRLSLLLKMAELFDVDFYQFTTQNIAELPECFPFQPTSSILRQLQTDRFPELVQQLQIFQEQTQLAEETLAGLQALNKIKLEQNLPLLPQDANNYIVLLNHLLAHNNGLIDTFTQVFEQLNHKTS